MTTDTKRFRVLPVSRRVRAFAAVTSAALAIAAITAGFALAQSRSSPIGTGVVVINTNLGYQGGAAAGTGMVLNSSGEVLDEQSRDPRRDDDQGRDPGDRP